MLPQAFGRRGRDFSDSRGLRGGQDGRDPPRNGDDRQRARLDDRAGHEAWLDGRDRRDRNPWRDGGREPLPPRGSTDWQDKSAPNDWSQHLLLAHSSQPGQQMVLGGARVAVPAAPAPSLWRALQNLDESRVQHVLEAGADVNERGGPYGSTPLGWVAQVGSIRLARMLISRGADPKSAAEKGSSPLHMATWNGDFVEIVKILLDAAADPEAHNASGQTALEVANTLDRLERTSPWQGLLETRHGCSHVRNRPIGRARVIVVLSQAMGVRPSAAAVAAAEAAARGVEATADAENDSMALDDEAAPAMVQEAAEPTEKAKSFTDEVDPDAGAGANADEESAPGSKSSGGQFTGEKAAAMELLAAEPEAAPAPAAPAAAVITA